MLKLILQENSFQINNGRNYLQTHGTAVGSKVTVAFANIYLSRIETEKISKSIDDVFSLWETGRETINQFVIEPNTHHPTADKIYG